MTEQTNAELIAENRKWVRLHQANKYQAEAARRMTRVLDRLEAADQRAELAEANLSVEESKNAGYRAKNNQLAVVVEMVRAADSASISWDHFGHLVMDILATAPTDALRELKADVWDEGAQAAYFIDPRPDHANAPANPYRAPEEQS